MAMKDYLKPWLLITIGILMNIVSAIVTHYFISQNHTKINAINQKITSIETNITQQWQSKIEMERKKEFILLLLNSQIEKPIHPSIKTYLEHYLNTIIKHHLTQQQLSLSTHLNIANTIKITQLAQQNVVDDINDQYFEKLELESSLTPLQEKNATLYSIAIFMQLIGLILVLSRDLARQ